MGLSSTLELPLVQWDTQYIYPLLHSFPLRDPKFKGGFNTKKCIAVFEETWWIRTKNIQTDARELCYTKQRLILLIDSSSWLNYIVFIFCRFCDTNVESSFASNCNPGTEIFILQESWHQSQFSIKYSMPFRIKPKMNSEE